MSLATLLFWSSVVLMVASRKRFLAQPHKHLVMFVFFACGFIPLGSLTVMQHWHSFVGHLSLLGLLWFASLVYDGDGLITKNSRAVLVTVAVLMLGFYGSALGVGRVDIYRYGFSEPRLLVLGFVVLSVVTAYARLWRLSAAISVALLAYAVDLLPSNNLWDYMVDPLLLIAVTIATMRALMTRQMESRVQ